MDSSTISNMKVVIRAEYETRISKLQHEMEAVLASLSTAEETLGNKAVIPDPVSPRPVLIRRNTPVIEQAKTLSAKSRILAQKNVITGRFLRMQLFNAVINDGNGEIPIGTFSLPFSVLAREGEIVLVEKGAGNTPSVYMWKEEVEKETATT